MSTPMRIAFALVVAAMVNACGNSSSPASPSPTTMSATIVNGAFSPNPINISVGSTVMWTNRDTSAHTIIADNGAFRSDGIGPGGSYSYTFPSAGTFGYHDAANPSMAGAVTVSGSSSPGPY